MYCSQNERMTSLSKTWTKLDSHLLCSVTLVCMVKGNAGQAASSTIMSSLLLWHIFKNSFNLGGYTGLNISIPRAASKKTRHQSRADSCTIIIANTCASCFQGRSASMDPTCGWQKGSTSLCLSVVYTLVHCCVCSQSKASLKSL